MDVLRVVVAALQAAALVAIAGLLWRILLCLPPDWTAARRKAVKRDRRRRDRTPDDWRF